MLIEQSFASLPEFLLGAPYLQYDEEGTLVMAFAMAILQELNGRNINNPISLIRGEVRYPSARSRSADLHLRPGQVGLLNDSLREYGYRQEAWLEAKFFRRNAQGRPMITQPPAMMGLIADLIRLGCLPSETPGTLPTSSRYLLHGYQGEASGFLAKKKYRQSAQPAKPAVGTIAARPSRPARPAFDREWTDAILRPGSATLDSFQTTNEVETFDNVVGNALRGIDLTIGVTNFVHAPASTTNDNFLLVLTRLDQIKVSMDVLSSRRSFQISNDGVDEDPPGSFGAIQGAVQAGLAH